MYKEDKFGFLIAYSYVIDSPIVHVSRHIKLLIYVVDGWLEIFQPFDLATKELSWFL